MVYILALLFGDIAGATQGPPVALSLENAVAMAFSKNTDLTVARQNRRIAGYRVISAQGAYDLRLQIEPSYSFSQPPVTNPFFAGPNAMPAQQSTLGSNVALSGRTRSGGAYSIGASASQTYDNTSINSFNPSYLTALSLNLSQPLLRGSAGDDIWRNLELARINSDLSNDQARLTAVASLADVLNTYYDLIAAWRNVAIQEDALHQAQAQSASNQRLVRQGAAAPLDVAEADAQVATFEDELASALQNVARLQNRLKQLILADPGDPLWSANLLPSSIMDVAASQAEPSLDMMLSKALRNRPEMAQFHESERSTAVDLAYARSRVLPQLDLNLGVSENGFAGLPNNPALSPFPAGPLPPSYENGKLGQAWTNAFNGRFPRYTLGATIGLPLRNRSAQGEFQAAREEERRLGTQRVALIQRIVFEARNALQSFRTGRTRLNAARAQRQAAERVFQGEQRRFASGASTTFLVLQRQVSLAQARGNELRAQTDLQEALVELERAQGTLLERYHIDVQKLP